ncbi:MAG TPA: histidine phosphatase family protein [Bacteroidia bacterium]|nr:histidine phosphatase family protein [Bacteroidia bacterium]
MKTLTIVRHAKSDWGNEGIDDILRPLSERGYSDARIISAQIQKKIQTPDYWVTSPAIRAYSTALIFANTFKVDAEKISINKKIYAASLKNLKQIISSIPDTCSNAILFGHNPELTNFFNEISDAYADSIPTCGTMYLTSAVKKWKDFLSSPLKNDFYLYPKEFKQ